MLSKSGTILESETGPAGTVSALHCPQGSCWFCHKILCGVLPSTPGAYPCKSVLGVLSSSSRSRHIRRTSHWAKPQKATLWEPPMNSEWSCWGRRRSDSYGLWGRSSWDSNRNLWRVSRTCCLERIPGSVTPRQEQKGKPAHRPCSQCCRDT